MADDAAVRGRALALEVRFEALQALERRASGGDEGRSAESVTAIVSGILRAELDRDLCALAVDVLGYHALPAPEELPGDNEAPVGGTYARFFRKGMLVRLFDSPQPLDAPRDRLAALLFGARNSGDRGNSDNPGKEN